MSTHQGKFGDERRWRYTGARIPSMRLFQGDLVAEIITDWREHPGILHCVVQKQGCCEILLLQQFYSQEEARVAAEQFMSTYAAMHRQVS